MFACLKAALAALRLLRHASVRQHTTCGRRPPYIIRKLHEDSPTVLHHLCGCGDTIRFSLDGECPEPLPEIEQPRPTLH